jgi:hypothetical protein
MSILPAMTLLRSLLILLVLALSPAHVAADGPAVHANAYQTMQHGMADCCDSGAHQMTCQMQTPLPEGMAFVIPMTAARQMPGTAAPDRPHGCVPEQALRPPILS